MFLPAAGFRDYSNGSVYYQGTFGYYWSSTPNSSYGYLLSFYSGNVYPSSYLNRPRVVAPVVATRLEVDPDEIVFEWDRSVITPASTPGQSVTVTVEADGPWTITPLTGDDAANFDVSDPVMDATGYNGTFTVTPNNPNYSLTDALTATITVVATGATDPLVSPKTVSVTQNLIELWGGENHVLYYTRDPKFPLAVGRWATSQSAEDIEEGIQVINDMSMLAYFKFGGVIGFAYTGTFTTTMSAIQFNPSALTYGTGGDITAYGNGQGSSINELPNIPGFIYADFDEPNNIRDISHKDYHNEANILKGKGDPCILAGIDMDQISRAGYLEEYKSGWRMPTSDENVAFLGITPDNLDHTYGLNSGYYETSGIWSGSGGSGVGIFPLSPKRDYVDIPRLPAAGYRVPPTGSALSRGSSVYYESSTPVDIGGSIDVNGPICLSELTLTLPVSNPSLGYTVRCIREY